MIVAGVNFVLVGVTVMRQPFRVMRAHPVATVAHPPIAIVPRMMLVIVADDYRRRLRVIARATGVAVAAATVIAGSVTALEREDSESECSSLNGNNNLAFH